MISSAGPRRCAAAGTAGVADTTIGAAKGRAQSPTVEQRARRFLGEFVEGWLPLQTAAAEADWAASTDVSEAHTAAQVAQNLVVNRFVGDPGHRYRPRAAENPQCDH